MTTLVGELRARRRRERFDRAAWGAARFAAVGVAALAVACAIDWWLDRERDTPFTLRAGLTACQFGLIAAAGYHLLVRIGVPSLDELAADAEAKIPPAGHRFVTALQLNRPSARTAGMSADLIAAVTREANGFAAEPAFGELTDRTRRNRAAALFLSTAVVVIVAVASDPGLATALLARQALVRVSIPRPVAVTADNPEVWPIGEGVELRFEVGGRVPDDANGTVTVDADDGTRDTFPLARIDGSGTFAATLPLSSVPFQYFALVAGGRTAHPGRVRFEPRPVVQEIAAQAVLPAFVDPEEKRRYERPQPLLIRS